MNTQDGSNSAAQGWRSMGRIIVSRLLAVLFVAILLLTEHTSDVHGLNDLFMGAVGLLLVHFGVRGRIWATLFIGGRKDSSLVTCGPYSLCRNPLYFYSGLAVMGVAAASGSYVVTLIVTSIYWVICHFTIAAEERKLRVLYGKAFEDYFTRVPRLFPLLGPAQEVNEVSFSPKRFHHTYRDATWFIVAWLAVTAIHILKARGALTYLLELP